MNSPTQAECPLSPPVQVRGQNYDAQIAVTLPYPDPRLHGSTFVLRPFQERDFDAAVEFSRDQATVLWVPPLPADDSAGVVELFEQYRVDGELLHLAIADHVSDSYLGEVMVMMCEHQMGEFGCGVVAEGSQRKRFAYSHVGAWQALTFGGFRSWLPNRTRPHCLSPNELVSAGAECSDRIGIMKPGASTR